MLALSTRYLDLTDKSDDFELPVAPQQAWLIVSLEFPLLYEGSSYLLMLHPYYGDYESPVNLGEGILYPPFAGFPVELGYFRRTGLGSVRRALDTREASVFTDGIVDQVAYNLGLGQPETQRVGIVEEYKLSPRGHDVHKVFRLCRYRCWHQSSKGKRDLSDPEALKGHTAVPLDLCRETDLEGLGPHVYRFLGKPLCSHFEKIVSTYTPGPLTSRVTEINERDLVNYEAGFVIHLDITGFGAVDLLAHTSGEDPVDSGEVSSQRFRFRLNRAFQVFFLRMGAAQRRTMGDGFVCGLPSRVVRGKDDAFYDNLAKATSGLCSEVSAMNRNLRDASIHLGVRLVIEKGLYTFGRVGGLFATNADFDGDTLLTLARCDHAIASTMPRATRQAALILGATRGELVRPLRDRLGGAWEEAFHEVTVKERSVPLYLLHKQLQ